MRGLPRAIMIALAAPIMIGAAAALGTPLRGGGALPLNPGPSAASTPLCATNVRVTSTPTVRVAKRPGFPGTFSSTWSQVTTSTPPNRPGMVGRSFRDGQDLSPAVF